MQIHLEVEKLLNFKKFSHAWAQLSWSWKPSMLNNGNSLRPSIPEIVRIMERGMEQKLANNEKNWSKK